MCINKKKRKINKRINWTYIYKYLFFKERLFTDTFTYVIALWIDKILNILPVGFLFEENIIDIIAKSISKFARFLERYV